MEKTINYESVPANYIHCFHHSCVRNKECMRYLAGQHCTTIHTFIRIINPACLSENASDCRHFRPIQKTHMAWGLKHLLDNIPNKDAKELKNMMLNHFGKTLYYRLYRKEYGITPEMQNFIRQIFKKKGITEEPAFDSYIDEYIWK